MKSIFYKSLTGLLTIACFGVVNAEKFEGKALERVSSNYKKYKSAKFDCSKFKPRASVGVVDTKLKDFGSIRECLADYAQSLLKKDSGSEAYNFYKGEMDRFSRNNDGLPVNGIDLYDRFNFIFPEKISNLQRNIFNGGQCLSYKTFDGVNPKRAVDNFKKQIEGYTRFLSVLHSRTLGRAMGVLFHIKDIYLCDQGSLKDAIGGDRDMVVDDEILYASLNVERDLSDDGDFEDYAEFGNDGYLEYLLKKWQTGEAIRHIVKTSDAREYVDEQDIDIPSYVPDIVIHTLNLGEQSDFRLLSMKEQQDLIGLSIEKISKFWPLFDYGGPVREKLRKKYFGYMTYDFMQINNLIKQNGLNVNTATQVKYNDMLGVAVQRDGNSPRRGFTQISVNHLKSIKNNSDKINELFNKWHELSIDTGYLGNVLDSLILSEDDGDSEELTLSSIPNFTFSDKKQDCSVAVKTFDNIRVNAALLSGLRTKSNIQSFGDKKAGDLTPDELIEKLRKADKENGAEYTLENNDRIIKRTVTVFKDGKPELVDSLAVPFEEGRDYYINTDEQNAIVCVESDDQVKVDAVVSDLTNKLNDMRPKAYRAMVLFDVLEEDRTNNSLARP